MEAPPPASTLGAGDLIDGGRRLDLVSPLGGAGTLLDGGRPCARRLELNDQADAETPNFGASAKEGEEPDEDACVDDADVVQKAIDDLDDDDLQLALALNCHISTQSSWF